MRLTCLVSLTVLVTTAALAAGRPCAQETFASPTDAARALVASIQTNNRALFRSITGQEIERLLGAGDPERDAMERESFIEAARRMRLEEVVEDARVIVLFYPGSAQQPFPAPLVKNGSGWCFDGESGIEIATSRRIHRNELAAIEFCYRYFDAETEYSTSDHGGAFARKIRSTPGKHDGLFWPIEGGVDESPIGPMFAAAAFEEQQKGVQPRPYFGYYFKVLVADSRGFVFLTWPAEYGVSGARSFLISNLGKVYQKDLGVDSARAAGRMTAFQRDDGWSELDEASQEPGPGW